MWPTPQAELLHSDVHQHRVRVPGRRAGGWRPCGDYPALPAVGEVVGHQDGGSGGGDGSGIRDGVLNPREMVEETGGGAPGFRPALLAGYSLLEGTWLKSEWDRNPSPCSPH